MNRSLHPNSVQFHQSFSLNADTVELAREVKLKRKQTSFVSNTQTRAEAVEYMIKEGLYEFSKAFDDWLGDRAVNWWPQGGSKIFPKRRSKEARDCQPFVSDMLRLFVTGKVTTEDQRSIKVRNIPNPDAFREKTVDTTSPDSVFYDGAKRGTSAISISGEVKGGGEGNFPPDEIGQLTDGMKRIMNVQPFRSEMTSFLTDGNRFLFVRIRRTEDGYQFQYSSIYSKKNGWQVMTL